MNTKQTEAKVGEVLPLKPEGKPKFQIIPSTFRCALSKTETKDSNYTRYAIAINSAGGFDLHKCAVINGKYFFEFELSPKETHFIPLKSILERNPTFRRNLLIFNAPFNDETRNASSTQVVVKTELTRAGFNISELEYIPIEPKP